MREITAIEEEQIASILAGCFKIMAVWLFGSAQKGIIRSGSDLDLAIFCAPEPALDELANLRANLQQILKIENIDLVVLNNASPILRFEAISGRAIFCRDATSRAAFASLTAREYEDEMAFLQRALRAYDYNNCHRLSVRCTHSAGSGQA